MFLIDTSDLDGVLESVIEMHVDWKELGFRLGLHQDILEIIDKEQTEQREYLWKYYACMRRMLAAWLQGEDDAKEQTWSVLVAALEGMGREELARKIRQNRM